MPPPRTLADSGEGALLSPPRPNKTPELLVPSLSPTLPAAGDIWLSPCAVFGIRPCCSRRVPGDGVGVSPRCWCPQGAAGILAPRTPSHHHAPAEQNTPLTPSSASVSPFAPSPRDPAALLPAHPRRTPPVLFLGTEHAIAETLGAESLLSPAFARRRELRHLGAISQGAAGTEQTRSHGP